MGPVPNANVFFPNLMELSLNNSRIIPNLREKISKFDNLSIKNTVKML